MAEVHQEVNVKRAPGKVLHAASAVGDIAEDDAVRNAGEGSEDVGDDQRVHQETLGELQRYPRGVRGANAPHDLVNLEVIVRRQQGNGGVQRGVL